MKRPLFTAALLAAALCNALAQGGGQRNQQAGQPEKPTPNPFFEIADSVTHHTLSLPGGPINYTATAAQIPLRSAEGDVECRMFYVAYTKDGADANKRPVTFAFNGGPGSATVWLHMGALGPKRAPMPDDGSLPAPPYAPVDNADTWLDFTDVVCVDAPGTGFSRIANQSLASRYFGVRPDIQAFTNFVKEWLKKHNRWTSPVFIAGESYGGIRGSGLSASLADEGVGVCGFVSISGTNNFMTLDGLRGNDSTYISFFPSMAACAWFHKKLALRFKSVESVVQEAQKWVEDEYTVALEKGDSLTAAEKDHIAQKMSEYLGLSKEYCLGSNLKVGEFAFFRQLLKDDGMTIGRYDGRLKAKEETYVGDAYSGDASDEAVTPPFTSAINSYFLNDLAVKTDMPYLTSGNVYPWSEPQGSYSETASDLRRLIARDPHFHVLYCCGYYDLACPLNGTVFMFNHLGLDETSRKQVSFAFYPAGHMMYIERSSRKKLHDDVAKFEADALAGR